MNKEKQVAELQDAFLYSLQKVGVAVFKQSSFFVTKADSILIAVDKKLAA